MKEKTAANADMRGEGISARILCTPNSSGGIGFNCCTPFALSRAKLPGKRREAAGGAPCTCHCAQAAASGNKDRSRAAESAFRSNVILHLPSSAAVASLIWRVRSMDPMAGWTECRPGSRQRIGVSERGRPVIPFISLFDRVRDALIRGGILSRFP